MVSRAQARCTKCTFFVLYLVSFEPNLITNNSPLVTCKTLFHPFDSIYTNIARLCDNISYNEKCKADYCPANAPHQRGPLSFFQMQNGLPQLGRQWTFANVSGIKRKLSKKKGHVASGKVRIELNVEAKC